MAVAQEKAKAVKAVLDKYGLEHTIESDLEAGRISIAINHNELPLVNCDLKLIDDGSTWELGCNPARRFTELFETEHTTESEEWLHISKALSKHKFNGETIRSVEANKTDGISFDILIGEHHLFTYKLILDNNKWIGRIFCFSEVLKQEIETA